MKNIIKFLMFIAYSTVVFFFPNNYIIVSLVLINICAMLVARAHIRNVICNTLKILPFIILTFLFNWLLDDINNAIWIGVKLLIVCNMTMVYASTTSIMRSSRNYKNIVYTTKNNKS